MAAKLGVSITISPVGDSAESPPTVSSVDRTNEWQPTLTLDENGLLHQLRATLVQSIDASTSKAFHHFDQKFQEFLFLIGLWL